MLTSNGPGPILMAYFTNWCHGKGYKVTDIPVEKLTHIQYAFAKIEDGRVAVTDSWADVEIPFEVDFQGQPLTLRGQYAMLNDPRSSLRARNPNIKVCISIGGWTHCGAFSDVCATPEAREKFAQSVVEFLDRFGFDGVDLDWEFPVEGGLESNSRRPDDGRNLTEMCRLLRFKLGELGRQKGGKHYELSIAAPSAEIYYRHFEMQRLSELLDYVNVMSYDLSGTWSCATWHHSALYPDVMRILDAYANGGFKKNQLLMGVPFYGRSFSGVDLNSNNECNVKGLSCKFKGAGIGAEPGLVDYHNYPPYGSGYEKHHDVERGAFCLFNPSTNDWISIEEVDSLVWKCEAVKRNGFGGMFWWEMSMDKHGTLSDAIWRQFHGQC